ncbi:MAG: hypothetical protein ACFFAU_01940 [Candidatus Hodarchaeota archaeon]
MISKSKIEKIVTRIITHDEKLGHSVGGSNHHSHTSFVMNTLGKPIKTQYNGINAWKITYIYTIITETEFTYYPDNPPYEHKYQKSIIIDQNGKLLKEHAKKRI